jgi:hypothetical protein
MIEHSTRTPRILPMVDALVVEVVGWEWVGWMRRREVRMRVNMVGETVERRLMEESVACCYCGYISML